MLKGPLIHPEVIAAIAAAGHGAKILVADANYPFSTMASPRAQVVYLNFTAGVVDVPTVVSVLCQTVPIESVEVNVPEDGSESAVIGELRKILGAIPMEKLRRYPFYEACKGEQVCLVIATGESRIYSCALLTIGFIPG